VPLEISFVFLLFCPGVLRLFCLYPPPPRTRPRQTKNRCWRLAIPCKPQEPKKRAGRRQKVESRPEEQQKQQSGVYESEGKEEDQMQVNRQQQGEGEDEKEQQQQQQQQRWWERQPEAMMHLSLVELCFHRNNPMIQAQTYLEVFH